MAVRRTYQSPKGWAPTGTHVGKQDDIKLKTHLEMLYERRTRPELEELLEERLAAFRALGERARWVH